MDQTDWNTERNEHNPQHAVWLIKAYWEAFSIYSCIKSKLTTLFNQNMHYKNLVNQTEKNMHGTRNN